MITIWLIVDSSIFLAEFFSQEAPVLEGPLSSFCPPYMCWREETAILVLFPTSNIWVLRLGTLS